MDIESTPMLHRKEATARYTTPSTGTGAGSKTTHDGKTTRDSATYPTAFGGAFFSLC